MRKSCGVLNVATGVSTSFRDIAEMIVALAKNSVPIRGTPRQNPITHRHFDITECLKAFPQFRYTFNRCATGLHLAAHSSQV